MMQFDVITIFPEMFEAVTRHGITRRALEEGGFDFRAWNPRDFVSDPHRTVDDRPYGGGPGMVMLPGPLEQSIDAAVARQVAAGVERPQVVLLSPQGERLSQKRAIEYSGLEHLVLVCGRYKGVDERVSERLVDEELSLGDFVLSGGEAAALCVVDAVARLLPGVVGTFDSVESDSFHSGLLDCAYYTRPAEYGGLAVPDVLLSGHHAQIAKARREEALRRTLERRPDLLESAELSDEDRKVLRRLAREREAGA